MSAVQWKVEGRQTYNGRHFWVVWKHNPKFYGGQQCLMRADNTDPKRFYDEAKAEAEAKRLNDEAASAEQGQTKGSANPLNGGDGQLDDNDIDGDAAVPAYYGL